MRTSTITPEQEAAIAAIIAAQPRIPAGIGTIGDACSQACITLAITGVHSDEIPDCESEVIGSWIIRTQDAMPADMRNSLAWRALLPRAAGTGRDPELERRRSALIVAHMWEVALPMAQPAADRLGYGDKWREMYTLKTAEAAEAEAAAAVAAAAAGRWAEAEAEAWYTLDPVGMLRRLVDIE
jgi:hypothetical protein